ncbi:MAG: hypothetical protein KAS32_01315 [Candidatus Peribacteraceae bacterium]|nr:hypothetical protein [Candidatus Peribacteraceae bacterium]
MGQKDGNNLFNKNSLSEAEINNKPQYVYTAEFIKKTVDNLFHKYASAFREDALRDLNIILRK